MFNHCFKGTYVDENDDVGQVKRKNASAIEREIAGCVRYECDNDTGGEKRTILCEEHACYNAECIEDDGHGECQYSEKEGYEEVVMYLESNPKNECYEAVCEGGEWVISKSAQAKEWESPEHGCKKYICDNESGNVTRSKCKEYDGQKYICFDDECQVEKDVRIEDELIQVDIELQEGFHLMMLDPDEVKEAIRVICGTLCETEEVEIGWETDEDDFVVRVMVYVKDQEAAAAIADIVSHLDCGSSSNA